MMNDKVRNSIQRAQLSEDLISKGLTFSLDSTYETPADKEI